VRSLFHLGLGALPSDPAALAGTLSALLKTRADAFQVGADVVRRLAAGRSPAEDAALAAGRPPGEDPALAAEAADGAAGAGAR
jgi:hypothetical protein